MKKGIFINDKLSYFTDMISLLDFLVELEYFLKIGSHIEI